MSRSREVDSECDLVLVAPAPVLPWLERADDRVLGRAGVRRRVTVRRGVTAAGARRRGRGAGGPPAADPQAVLATRNVRGQLSDANRVQMRADVRHSFFPLSESARRSAVLVGVAVRIPPRKIVGVPVAPLARAPRDRLRPVRDGHARQALGGSAPPRVRSRWRSVRGRRARARSGRGTDDRASARSVPARAPPRSPPPPPGRGDEFRRAESGGRRIGTGLPQPPDVGCCDRQHAYRDTRNHRRRRASARLAAQVVAPVGDLRFESGSQKPTPSRTITT